MTSKVLLCEKTREGYSGQRLQHIKGTGIFFVKWKGVLLGVFCGFSGSQKGVWGEPEMGLSLGGQG